MMRYSRFLNRIQRAERPTRFKTSRLFSSPKFVLQGVFKVKKFFRSKLFLSVILLLITAFLIFGVLPTLEAAKTETITVVQCIDNVEAGTQITESMLTTKTVGKLGLDNSVITDKTQIAGKYAATDIRRSTALYADMFSESWEEVDGAVDTMIGEKDKLITVSLSSGAASVGGQIRPGSRVDVLTEKVKAAVPTEYGYTVDDTIEMERTTILSNVLVYKVMNANLEDITDLTRQWKALQSSGSDEELKSSLIPAYVTLAVNDEQALKLANQEYSGTIHLVLTQSTQDTAAEKKASAEPTAKDTTPAQTPADPNAQAGENTPANPNGGSVEPDANKAA